ncbi:helix-turn-helix transcriptional regulator [Micromonospora sp. M12]
MTDRRRHRLAQRRKTIGLSQERLAEALGVDRSTIVRWERAETDPQPWHRPRLAAALKLPIEELADLLADVGQAPSPPAERLGYVLRNPGRVDLIAVAYLRERVRRLDERYDQTPRRFCSPRPGNYTVRQSSSASTPATGRFSANWRQRSPSPRR